MRLLQRMNTINNKNDMDTALIGWTRTGDYYERGNYIVYFEADLDEWVFASADGDPLVGGATPAKAVLAGKRWLSDLFLEQAAKNELFRQHCELLDAERF